MIRPLSWFLLGVLLALVAGIASAGYSLGDGQCYETRAQAMESAYRTYPRLISAASASSGFINLPDPCTETGGYFLCSFVDGDGQPLGSYRLVPTNCETGIEDVTFNAYWLAPAVLGFFAIGWKLGMAR